MAWEELNRLKTVTVAHHWWCTCTRDVVNTEILNLFASFNLCLALVVQVFLSGWECSASAKIFATKVFYLKRKYRSAGDGSQSLLRRLGFSKKLGKAEQTFNFFSL